MKFSSTNLPELGSKVWFVTEDVQIGREDVQTGRPVIKSGFVFAHMLRYGIIGALILVDIEVVRPEDMEQTEEDLDRYSPEFLFDSAEAAGASIS
jgi:hypothetical protein